MVSAEQEAGISPTLLEYKHKSYRMSAQGSEPFSLVEEKRDSMALTQSPARSASEA